MTSIYDALWDEINNPNGGRLALSHHRATTAGGVMGWVCTTAGYPGTWKTFGAITP